MDLDSSDSLTVVVNKARSLQDPLYIPKDLHDAGGVWLRFEASVAFLRLCVGAASDSIAVVAVDGYRSAVEQARIYGSYQSIYGAAVADRISARPGYSEHQTGLSVDVASPDGSFALSPSFDATPTGSWVAANAHRYGFLIRYPMGQEEVTGFAYEPWHLRYVGTRLAPEVYASSLALEGFFGLPPAPSYRHAIE